MARGNSRLPKRVGLRPAPDEWQDGELMTLDEAAALFWPLGPLTVTSLRTAVRDGVLDVAEIAGKLLTTKEAIRKMSICRPRRGARPTETAGAPQSIAAMQERYLDRLKSN
jgi:hypothetical protein